MPSVIAGDLRRRIQSSMGDESGTFITAEDCYDWIMDAQHQISKLTECLTADLPPINSVLGQERYALSNALLKVLRVTYEGRKLEKITIEHLDMIDPNRDVVGSSNGVPTHYYIDGSDIGLWHKPSASVANAIKIRARILATSTIDDDADIIQIPDYFMEDIFRYATLKGREKDESPEFMAVLFADWQNKIAVSKSIANNPEASYQSVTDIESAIDYQHDWYV